MSEPTLYEWLECQIAGDQVVDQTRYAATTGVIHHLGVLMGIGHDRQALMAFVDRVLSDSERMLALVAEGATAGEALDALTLAGPSLAVIEGGKGQPS